MGKSIFGKLSKNLLIVLLLFGLLMFKRIFKVLIFTRRPAPTLKPASTRKPAPTRKPKIAPAPTLSQEVSICMNWYELQPNYTQKDIKNKYRKEIKMNGKVPHPDFFMNNKERQDKAEKLFIDWVDCKDLLVDNLN
jgi:hypothetical protein